MTWPVSYNDVPSKNDFPIPDEISENDLAESLKGFLDKRTSGQRKNFDVTTYNDGIYVGYRYYTTKNVPVSYPFGYGMSYTSFGYGKPVVTKEANGDINVAVSVKNTGKVAGKEVVQVYVAAPGKDMDKPARELKGFAKTRKLGAGESETVTITVPYESLAFLQRAGQLLAGRGRTLQSDGGQECRRRQASRRHGHRRRQDHRNGETLSYGRAVTSFIYKNSILIS
jgi:beta-glucosidase